MRVLIFHGYLLRGTGSNIYNSALARALVSLGHEVHLLCQERHADELDYVEAVGTFRGDELTVEGSPGARLTVYLPDIAGVLPVYVADRYEDFEAVPFPALDEAGLERYLQANVGAVRAVADRVRPDVALANHAVMGPVILARALGDSVPYAVKIHGSALEYVVRLHPKRFAPLAREGLRGARGILVGSRHTAESVREVLGGEDIDEKVRLGPPGVDVHEFHPRAPAEAAAALDELADRLERGGRAGWGAEPGAPAALRSLDPQREPLVGYVGKLIVSKGVDLLLAAWPLVWERVPAARLCVVGFGTFREGLDRLLGALASGDLAQVRELAERGRELEGGPRGPLGYLASFLDGLRGERRVVYLDAARQASLRVHFTGALEHRDLPAVLPAFRAQVVPSTFPEAFGMVAAEAAVCGVLPVSAAHSGLAEVSAGLAPALPGHLRRLLSFERGPQAVEDLADRLVTWLELDPEERREAAGALAAQASERFGWEGVARGVIAAAEGRLDDLADPLARDALSAGPDQ